MREFIYRSFLIAAFISLLFAITLGGCTATAPPPTLSSAPTPAAVTTIASQAAALQAKVAAFNAGVKNITPEQIQADSVKLQAQIAAFNAAAAPVVNTMAGVAEIAATATGNPEIAPIIALANGAVQAANAVTKAQVPGVISLPIVAPVSQ